MNYNASCSTGWRVNATYRHLLELYMAEQAKGHIFSAKEDYLKGERFVMVSDFELTHCLYSTISVVYVILVWSYCHGTSRKSWTRPSLGQATKPSYKTNMV
jgi:hypothetical protein